MTFIRHWFLIFLFLISNYRKESPVIPLYISPVKMATKNWLNFCSRNAINWKLRPAPMACWPLTNWLPNRTTIIWWAIWKLTEPNRCHRPNQTTIISTVQRMTMRISHPMTANWSNTWYCGGGGVNKNCNFVCICGVVVWKVCAEDEGRKKQQQQIFLERKRE